MNVAAAQTPGAAMVPNVLCDMRLAVLFSGATKQMGDPQLEQVWQ